MLLFIRSHRCNCCCCCCCCCCLFVYIFLSMLLLLFSFRSYNAMLLWNTIFPSVVYCCYFKVLRKSIRDSLVFRDSIPNTYDYWPNLYNNIYILAFSVLFRIIYYIYIVTIIQAFLARHSQLTENILQYFKNCSL